MASINITPIKVGLKFDPPSIILVYRDKSKLRERIIPAKNLDILTDLRLYVEKFKNDQKYKKHFEKISNNKLEKMLFILQDNMKGYNLSESLERAKKYDKSLDDSDIPSELNTDNKSKNKENDYDDDFHDTEDEEEKNSPSISTLDDVKAKKESLFATLKFGEYEKKEDKNPISKSTALDLLSTQMKAVKSNFYDFEDEVEEEISNSRNSQDEDENDDNVDDGEKILNFSKNFNKKEEEKIETAQDDDDSSDSSF